MKKMFAAAAASVALLSTTAMAQHAMPPLTPDQVEFKALYKELIETNTTLSGIVGSALARPRSAGG